MLDPRNILLARKAKKYGMQNSLRIVVEARKAGVPISLAFAVAEQETGTGRNVWGGDPAPNGGTNGLNNRTVTRARYAQYKRARGATGRGGMQGVGPYQLTWWEFQDAADRLGGCDVPRYNIQLALTHLGKLVKAYGTREGVKRYNGNGAAADRYQRNVNDVLAPKWHRRLS